jgi:hypothetical protein
MQELCSDHALEVIFGALACLHCITQSGSTIAVAAQDIAEDDCVFKRMRTDCLAMLQCQLK